MDVEFQQVEEFIRDERDGTVCICSDPVSDAISDWPINPPNKDIDLTSFNTKLQLQRFARLVACWKGNVLQLALFIRHLTIHNRDQLKLLLFHPSVVKRAIPSDVVPLEAGRRTCSPLALSTAQARQHWHDINIDE